MKLNRRDPIKNSTADFQTLIDWYERHCDGDWEHHHGIRLESLDNPGWLLTINLIHTDLQGRKMAELSEGCSPDGNPVSPKWIHCTVEDNQFRAGCDPQQLPRLFAEFERFRAGDK